MKEMIKDWANKNIPVIKSHGGVYAIFYHWEIKYK
jgi:hypothetical protein